MHKLNNTVTKHLFSSHKVDELSGFLGPGCKVKTTEMKCGAACNKETKQREYSQLKDLNSISLVLWITFQNMKIVKST